MHACWLACIPEYGVIAESCLGMRYQYLYVCIYHLDVIAHPVNKDITKDTCASAKVYQRLHLSFILLSSKVLRLDWRLITFLVSAIQHHSACNLALPLIITLIFFSPSLLIPGGPKHHQHQRNMRDLMLRHALLLNSLARVLPEHIESISDWEMNSPVLFICFCLALKESLIKLRMRWGLLVFCIEDSSPVG